MFKRIAIPAALAGTLVLVAALAGALAGLSVAPSQARADAASDYRTAVLDAGDLVQGIRQRSTAVCWQFRSDLRFVPLSRVWI